MNSEIKEALAVLKRVSNDVDLNINAAQRKAKLVKTREARANETRVAELLPNLYPETYAALKKSDPKFVAKSFVETTFKNNKPRFFGMFNRRTHKKDLEFIQTQYLAWLSQNTPSDTDQIYQDLAEMYTHQIQLSKTISLLIKLDQVNGVLNDQLKAQIKKLAGISYNHSRARQDPYAMSDGIDFAEDWVEFGELVTQLFITYEALAATDAVAEVIEQVYDDNAQYAVEVADNGEWVHHAENEPAVEVVQPSVEIKTDDSLGYYS